MKAFLFTAATVGWAVAQASATVESYEQTTQHDRALHRRNLDGYYAGYDPYYEDIPFSGYYEDEEDEYYGPPEEEFIYVPREEPYSPKPPRFNDNPTIASLRARQKPSSTTTVKRPAQEGSLRAGDGYGAGTSKLDEGGRTDTELD